jgi:ankyrin repeat protein
MFRGRRLHGLAASLAGAVCLSTLLGAAAPAPVADAAMQRDRETVRTLLKQGGDVNAAQGDGMTALHWAAMQNDAEMASMLLYAGANHRATTRLGGYAPLHLASQIGAASIIGSLIDAGADVNARTSTGATALMLAATSGQTDAVSRLLDRGADVNATESTYGQTALMFAAARDRANVISVLMARGADATIASKFTDLAALTAPAEPDRQAAGQRAQAQGPAPEPTQAAATPPRRTDVAGVTRSFRYNELIGSQGGLTALHFAARQGSSQSVRALVEAGADVNQPSPGDKTTPLLIATINGHWPARRVRRRSMPSSTCSGRRRQLTRSHVHTCNSSTRIWI